jgi:hypothetical protein
MAALPFVRLGQYELIAAIGAGGMGEVYSAQDARLGRKVALKILPPALAADAAALARFEREARALAALNHPNILSIFDFGRDGETVYAVMELLEGRTLRDVIGDGPVAPRRLLEIAIPVARGLASAHEKGIIHRDLKPENVFLTRDAVKVLDFGLARTGVPTLSAELVTQGMQSNLTAEGAILGTVGYMAPEQVRGETADARTDLFAFGILLYEMATGARPFQGHSGVETLHAILRDEPALIGPERKLPVLLEGIIRRCLEKDPGLRFQSGRDLAFALEQSAGASGSGADLQRLPAAAPARPRSGRIATGIAVLAILLAGAVSWRLWRTPTFTLEPILPFAMTVTSARFMPDGRAVVFSAIKDGHDELFLQTPGEAAPRLLGVRDARVLAVSARGEIALNWTVAGKPALAVLSAPGLAPKVLQERPIQAACWDREGKDLIVKENHYQGQATRALLYRGKVIYSSPIGFGIEGFALTADGLGIGFLESRAKDSQWIVVNLDGSVRLRTETRLWGPGVTAAGRCIAWDSSHSRLVALDERGRVDRELLPCQGWPGILDGRPSGEILIADSDRNSLLTRVWWKRPEQPEATTVDAFPGAYNTLLARGGTRLGFTRMNDDFDSDCWLLDQGGAAFTPLGKGELLDLAENGDRALVLRPSAKGGLALLVQATGSGSEMELPDLWVSAKACFFQNGSRALVTGLLLGAKDARQGASILDTATGQMRPLTFSAEPPCTEDGRWAFARRDGEQGFPEFRVDLETGQKIGLPAACQGLEPVGWADAGKAVWALRHSKAATPSGRGFPVALVKVALDTGKLLATRTIAGSGAPGSILWRLRLAGDGQAFTFSEDTPGLVPTRLYRLSGLR